MRLSARSIRTVLLLSVTWMICVLCVAVYEHARYSPWCEVAGPMSTSSSCSPWFWTWYAKGDLPRFIVAPDPSSATSMFLPRVGSLLAALLPAPVGLLCAALGAVWGRNRYQEVTVYST
jgi:hypothetical protein